MKRLVVEADLHCHHRAGLCAPEFWLPEDGVYGKWGQIQRELWNTREEIIAKVGPIDYHAINGDATDGRGERSGGTELLPNPSWLNQVKNAEECIRAWDGKNPPKRIMSRGTGYHVGNADDHEDELAARLGATVKDHPFFEIDGVVFDMKHKVGASSIPHGRGTPIARERLWNVLWAERDEQPRAQVIIRSHVHYFTYIGGHDWVAMTTPALQAAGTKYGGRMCSSTVDWGLVVFEIENGEFDWHVHLVKMSANKVEAVKL